MVLLLLSTFCSSFDKIRTHARLSGDPTSVFLQLAHRRVFSVMLWARVPSATRFKAARAQAVTGGGRALENRYGRARWRNRSTRGCGPTVKPPAGRKKQPFKNKQTKKTIKEMQQKQEQPCGLPFSIPPAAPPRAFPNVELIIVTLSVTPSSSSTPLYPNRYTGHFMNPPPQTAFSTYHQCCNRVHLVRVQVRVWVQAVQVKVRVHLLESGKKHVKSFNTARVVKQMSTLMLKYGIYAFSVEKQLKSVLNIWNVKILLLLW